MICVVETWLCPDISNSELSMDGYTVVRSDRDRHGGGVMFFISSNLDYNVLYKPIDLEFLMVSVSKAFTHNCTASRKTCISFFYRPPSSPRSVFCKLHNILQQLNPSLFSSFVIIGDFL